ncbi:MAG: aldehyde ferredoxin oxidoreductase family protein [Lacipirellulaceae bacterium]
MNSPPGYHGKYLRIDLTTGHSQSMPIAASLFREYLGGSGLGTALLLEAGAAEAEPLSKEATLAFVFSPLVGSPLTTSAKFAVVGKSPLTGRINDSLASSGFAIAGKKTGHDAILLTGQAVEPSVVLIDEEEVRVESAGDLWGQAIPDAEEQLRRSYPSEFSFAVIGPAGERQVRYATISHDGRHAGRGGSGAVLGAKNVKAIGVRGNRRCEWSHPERLVEYAKRLSAKSFGPATAKYRELGTASNLLAFNRLNVLPTRNFQRGSFEGAMAIAPEQLSVARERTRASCAACTIGCEHLYSLKDERLSGKSRPVRLEYENLFALGPLCEVSDPEVVLTASQKCDELGLDTISAGGTIAFAMECQQKGYLQSLGIDAKWLQFGSGEGLLRALDEIAEATSLGKLLASGSRAMADLVGHDSLDFAPQVKGLELPGYDPRGLQTMALGFAVGTRGADHNRSGAYEADFSEEVDRRHAGPGSARLAVETEDKAAIMDSLILCKFLRGVFEDFFLDAAEMLSLVTGWDVTREEMRATARRIVDAKKQFNIKAGWTPAEDTLPKRMLNSALEDDEKATLPSERLDSLIQAYNLERGWTREGWLEKE